LVLLVAGLSGCAPPNVEITSGTAADIHVEIKRLVIVTDVTQFRADIAPHGMQISALKGALTDALGKCGITVSFLSQDQIPAIYDNQEFVRTFSPDAILFLEQKYIKDGTPKVDERYSAGIVDMATRKLAWSAKIDMRRGWSREEALATTIVDRLKNDSIFGSSCAGPIASQRSP